MYSSHTVIPAKAGIFLRPATRHQLVMPAQAGIHALTINKPNCDASPPPIPTPSLRARKSARGNPSYLFRVQLKDGLLRYARNDGAARPGRFEDRALVKAVKDATRRLRRSPAAILDRFSQRAILNPAGTENRPFQPNKET